MYSPDKEEGRKDARPIEKITLPTVVNYGRHVYLHNGWRHYILYMYKLYTIYTGSLNALALVFQTKFITSKYPKF